MKACGVKGTEPDKRILAAAQDGDAEAFRRVVEAYEALVYNLAFRLTYSRVSAEDLAQECFLRVHRKFDRYDLSLPFRPWLVRLVMNTGLSWLRAQKRQAPAAGGWQGGEPDPRRALLPGGERPGPAEIAEVDEMRGLVRRAVAALPGEYKAVIALRYFEGMDYKTIARMLTVPVGTVKIRLYRARQTLKRRLALVADAK